MKNIYELIRITKFSEGLSSLYPEENSKFVILK